MRLNAFTEHNPKSCVCEIGGKCFQNTKQHVVDIQVLKSKLKEARYGITHHKNYFHSDQLESIRIVGNDTDVLLLLLFISQRCCCKI